MKKSKLESQSTFPYLDCEKANEITELGKKYLKEIMDRFKNGGNEIHKGRR
jgi:hypothetical protein